MTFGGIYSGKKVLVTGHTGFKGAWLTSWLLKLGARVAGYSKDIPTKPSMFCLLDLEHRISHHAGDVRDLQNFGAVIERERPDYVIHLAAQAIVSCSYLDPIETVTTNVVGTLNVLETLRRVDWPCVAVLITSDKCYDNVEWVWGYRETDKLGGKDVYSGSKAAAEVIIRSYIASFFQRPDSPVRIGVARAGNVIGGGDWAADRIIADCMRAWSSGKPAEIRCPSATRPWQHVLEPLSGYLRLAWTLSPGGRGEDTSRSLHGEAFNFGPRAEQSRTVAQLIERLADGWGFADPVNATRTTPSVAFHEATLLKLNCDKALLQLKWEPNLSYDETVQLVSDWYVGFYRAGRDMFALTNHQIEAYETLARQRSRIWVS